MKIDVTFYIIGFLRVCGLFARNIARNIGYIIRNTAARRKFLGLLTGKKLFATTAIAVVANLKNRGLDGPEKKVYDNRCL